MTQQQISATTGPLGANGNLNVYTVPGSVIVEPVSAAVIFDGTSAAGSFIPCLTFKTQTGAIIARCPAPGVAAGDTAEVSWFPGVTAIPSSSAVLPGTSVTRSVTSQTVANNTSTDCSFDTVLFDDLGWFTLAHPTKITVNIPGQFLVMYTNAWVYPGGGGFAIETGIGQRSPTTIVVSEQIVAAASTPNTTSGAGIVNASAGQWFTLFLYQASGGNMSTWIAGSSGTDIQSLPTLSVVRIGDRVG